MSDDEAYRLASALRPTVTRLYLTLRRRTPIAEYSAAQASALSVLLDHGPLRMGELAERESIRMPTATALIDGLTKNGLVERTPDPADRRAVLVGLTDHGRTVLDRVRGRRDTILTAALAGLTDDDRAALAAAAPALEALRHQIEALPNPEGSETTAG
ncbi:MarR family transcriptional regulator [Gordonia sp. HNM0687]|uniref:MarR family transcriptional regulator n=1 Tax=Gordonia mangrovi TaxID=2665643 RepID=A0A6L7GRZ0_9ACTN|nr:MarR family transcriptional regulator [Gordonia mangrovi]MXP21455.1 MarR family transcriptional regulator [Gordonia mangrovi]UVF80201.1 MarR family transcriptional regulator [Gordonia mangrovi]